MSEREFRTASEAAEWFLSQQDMSIEKVKMLCYYAQAWALCLHGGLPLFRNEIIATSEGIDIPAIKIDPLYQEVPALLPTSEFAPMDTMVLDVVLRSYGRMETDKLASIIKQEEPWIEARSRFNPADGSKDPIISMEMMQDFYFREFFANEKVFWDEHAGETQ